MIPNTGAYELGKRRGQRTDTAFLRPEQRKPSTRVRGKPLPLPKWFVVHTQAGQEKLADAKLQQAGYMTFYAFDRLRRRRKRPGTNTHVVEWIERPYFSRYIFVALRFAEDNIQQIEECDGVSCVVRRRLSSEPMEIPHRDLDELMEMGMVRFDVEGYRVLMRELVLDPGRLVTLYVDERGRRRMKSDLLPTA
jgi:transcription antitermination factor NusG